MEDLTLSLHLAMPLMSANDLNTSLMMSPDICYNASAMQDREPFIKSGSAADFTVAAMLLLLLVGIVFGLVAFILAKADPHRVVVTGPSRLVGGSVVSNDIRAGIALVIAAFCARGESVISAAETIDRGYVAVEDSLAALSADIRRVK